MTGSIVLNLVVGIAGVLVTVLGFCLKKEHPLGVWLAWGGSALMLFTVLWTCYHDIQSEKENAEKASELAAANAKIINLEKKTAPRQISDQQSRKLKEVLAQFQGMRVNFEVKNGDQEMQNFAIEVQSAFSDAGWQVGPVDTITMPGTTVEGMKVSVFEKDVERLTPVFETLRDWGKVEVVPQQKIPPGLILVLVGARPL